MLATAYVLRRQRMVPIVLMPVCLLAHISSSMSASGPGMALALGDQANRRNPPRRRSCLPRSCVCNNPARQRWVLPVRPSAKFRSGYQTRVLRGPGSFRLYSAVEGYRHPACVSFRGSASRNKALPRTELIFQHHCLFATGLRIHDNYCQKIADLTCGTAQTQSK